MQLPKFEYFTPETIDEAFSILLEYGDKACVLAGGTDLLVKMKQRSMKPLPEYVVNIKKIPGLDYISYDEEEGLRLGALATIQEIKSVSKHRDEVIETLRSRLNINRAHPHNRGIPKILSHTMTGYRFIEFSGCSSGM